MGLDPFTNSSILNWIVYGVSTLFMVAIFEIFFTEKRVSSKILKLYWPGPSHSSNWQPNAIEKLKMFSWCSLTSYMRNIQWNKVVSLHCDWFITKNAVTRKLVLSFFFLEICPSRSVTLSRSILFWFNRGLKYLWINQNLKNKYI